MEAALGRRLDRLTRHVERLERHITISNEGFVEALGRRLARGQTLAQEISLDIDPAQTPPTVPRE